MGNGIVIPLTTLLLTGIFASHASCASTKVLVEWDFKSADDAAGWMPNASIQSLAVKDGRLVGCATGTDPSLIGPLVEIPANTYQLVEFRMRTTASGTGELFWTNTTEEQPYHAFCQEKSKRIDCTGGEFRVYRILPFWQLEGKIIRLRLDPPEGADFELDYIKVLEIVGLDSTTPFCDFGKGEHWIAAGDVDTEFSAVGLRASGHGELLLISPPVGFQAEGHPWLSYTIRAKDIRYIELKWLTDSHPFLRSRVFDIKDDGEWHTYNLSFANIPGWQGKVLLLGLSANLKQGARIEIASGGGKLWPAAGSREI